MTIKLPSILTVVLFALLVALPVLGAEGDYDRGVAYLRAGNPDEALKLLMPLVPSRSGDPYLQYHIGLAHYKTDELDEARAAFDRTRELAKPGKESEFGLGTAYSNLGVAYYRRGDNEKARQCFGEALRINPDDGDSTYYMGLAYMETGDYARAEEELGKAGKLLKGNESAAAVRNALGMVKFRQGDNEAAIREFTRTLDISPDNVEALYYLGQLNYKERGFASAKPYFDRLTHIGATDEQTRDTLFTTFFNMGVDFQDRGMSGTAAEMFERASTLAPDDAETHYYRGYNLMALDRYTEAVDEFRRALSLDPSLKRAQAQLEVAGKFAAEQSLAEGRRLTDAEDYYAAIPYFEKAVSLDPKSREAADGLGKARDAAEKDAAGRIDMAKSFMAKGEYGAAMNEVEWLLKKDPGSKEAAGLRAEIAAKQTEETEALLASATVSEKKELLGDALRDYKKVLSISPDNRKAKDGVSRIEASISKLRAKAGEARESGLLIQARNSFKKLLGYLPDDWEASTALAEVESEINTRLESHIKDARDSFGAEDYSMAAHHAGRALELDPANTDALELRQRIKDRSRELVMKYVHEGDDLLANGQREKALERFESALLLDPDNASAKKGREKASYVPPSAEEEDEVRKLYLKGVEHYTKGELDEAVAAWREVLKIDPSNEKAASSIKRAEEKLRQTEDAGAEKQP